MAKIWANRLVAGTQAWADVPLTRQTAVKAELAARVAAGEITAERYAEITSEAYTA